MKFAFQFSLILVFVYSVSLAQPNFNRITCGGNITLNIKQGDTCNSSSSGDSKSENANKIIFEVYNNTLHIENGVSNNAIANIVIKELKGLNINGAARVFCENILVCDELKAEFNGASKGLLKLDANVLTLEANGASQIELQGKCSSLYLELDGASKVNAKRLLSSTCNVETNGASVCMLDSVTSNLKVEAKGASKIYLNRIPETYVASRNGSGKIVEGSAKRDTTLNVETMVVINDAAIDTGRPHPNNYHENYHEAGFNWTGIDLGFNGMLNASKNLKAPAGYEYLEMNNASSMQVNLNLFEKDFNIHKHYVMGMVGAGFSWSNFKFTTPFVLQPYQPTLNAIKDSGKVFNTNKLRVSYFNIPAMIGFNTSQKESKALHIAVGVVTGVRLGAMVKTTTDSKDGKNKAKAFALYNTDQVRYDVMIRLKYKWANIWASYSLNGLFKKNHGPEVHPIAVGVNVLEF